MAYRDRLDIVRNLLEGVNNNDDDDIKPLKIISVRPDYTPHKSVMHLESSSFPNRNKVTYSKS
jgi:hypothetical protein